MRSKTCPAPTARTPQRNIKPAALQTLATQNIAVAVPHKQLYLHPRATDEHEDITRERVFLQFIADKTR